MTMTWAELRTDVCRRLDTDEKDVLENIAMWSDDDLKWYCNDGLRDISQRLMILREVKSIPTVAEQAAYEMPENMVKAYRLEYYQSDNYVITLEYYPLLEFDDIRGVLRNTSGFPFAWSTWGYPGGGGQIILDRAPSESRADGLRLYYYRLPRTMVADEDPVDIPSGWERLVALYAEAQARRKEATDQRWSQALQLYESGLEEMRRVAVEHNDQPSYFSDGGYGRATAIFGSGEW